MQSLRHLGSLYKGKYIRFLIHTILFTVPHHNEFGIEDGL